MKSETIETWKAVPEFPTYEVSDKGRVRCWIGDGKIGRRTTPRLRKIQIDKDGYPFIVLYDKGRTKGFRLSRLVLLAFASEDFFEGAEASHLNGIKTDCRLDNLKWESRLENEQRKIEHGTRPRGERAGPARLTEDDVRAIRKMRAEEGISFQKIADLFKVSKKNVMLICRGEAWRHVK